MRGNLFLLLWTDIESLKRCIVTSDSVFFGKKPVDILKYYVRSSKVELQASTSTLGDC